jgi:hypothetical protein
MGACSNLQILIEKCRCPGHPSAPLRPKSWSNFDACSQPTVRPDLEEIIALSVGRGFRVRIVTNAVTLDREGAKSFRSSGLKLAQVSLMAPEKKRTTA